MLIKMIPSEKNIRITELGLRHPDILFLKIKILKTSEIFVRILFMEKTKYYIFIFYRLPVFIYCTAIFIQSSYPSAVHAPEFPHIDKLIHFSGYGLLGILFFRAFRVSRFGKNPDVLMLISMAASALYGISDEIHQHYVPSRSADIMDVWADTLGSICGVFFYELIAVRYYKRLSRCSVLRRILRIGTN